MKILMLYRRRWWMLYLPFLLLLLVATGAALRLWEPIPPRAVTIGTGPAQSSYLILAKAYAEHLETLGIEARIVTYARPQDPLYALRDSPGDVDVTFAQGLYANDPIGPVKALSVVGHELVWTFAREGIYSSADLLGKRVATSVNDSSNRRAAQILLEHLHIAPNQVKFTDDVGDAAINAFARGEVDAVIHVSTGASQTAATLARMPGARILGVERAGALAARDPRLRAMLLPQGAIELRANLPPADLPILVTQTHLVVRGNLHPALQRALLDVAHELHSMNGFLERQGTYPSVLGSDFPVSDVATLYERGERPWLERLLPYRTAQWAQLLLFLMMPIMVLGLMFALRMPGFFQWRLDAVLQHFYGELKFLEEELQAEEERSPPNVKPLIARLDALERQIAHLEFPDRFADRWYTLREHLYLVRERFQTTQSQFGPSSRPSR